MCAEQTASPIHSGPRVSVGIPVYNGEEYIAQAIDAVLAQDYQDLEIIIADNASTDSTPAICADYEQRDSRIQYVRHDENVGSLANFNFVARKATAPYFLWAADDDRYRPDYIRKCVAMLESKPDAVLCSSLVRIIGADGEEIAIYDSGLSGADDVSPAKRFAALIMHRHLCTDMFGVMRKDALLKTELMNDYYGGDRGFLAEMALLGPVLKVREPLFENREHAGRESRSAAASQLRYGRRMPVWNLYRQYRRAITRQVTSADDRKSCYRLLRRWWFVDWNIARVLVDVVGIFWPPVYRIVNRMKVILYGPVPQIRRKD